MFQLPSVLKIFITTTALALLSLGCGKVNKKASKTEAPFCLSDSMRRLISLHQVKKEEVIEILRLSGKIDVDESKMIKIYPLVGGFVEEVKVELGDYVEKGQTLAIVKSVEAAEIEKDIIGDAAQLHIAEKNVQVAEDMYGSGLLSEKDYVQAKNELYKIKAEYERSLEIYNIYSLKKNAHYIIKSPMAGFIVDKDLNTGMQLRSDNQNYLFKIANLNNVWLIANVYETDVIKIIKGAPVTINILAYPDKQFTGKIDKIYDFIDPDTKVLKIRINLDNPERLLKPEMLASVNVHIPKGENMLTIPSESVVFDKNKYYVIVYKDRCNVETREINIYSSSAHLTYVADGISVDEKIICKQKLLIYKAIND